ncbi:protein sprT [Bacillus infantis]|uniref:protein sprT n=1 Tax=Bacillus infantis TaxID=324767 RepID=UPI0020A16714|nr:protein sprT [Bacillus infantis]MCP1159383.1 protein sprT [Bacillus infantis]
MRNIIIGEHYSYDNGNPLEKVVMFVTANEKYMGENVYYYDTISLNYYGEVFQKDYELSFFESDHIRLATKSEINELREYCPININWVNEKIEEIITNYWDIKIRPKVIFDPDEPLERPFYGAYDSNLEVIIFRSEFLILKDVNIIEKYLAHELCHWYLHQTGEPFRDKDIRFAKEIIRLGLDETVNFHNPEAKEAYIMAKVN